MAENWLRSYREAPDVFDAFRRAEDPDGRVLARLAELAPLAGRTVVEVGAGTGRTARALAPASRLYVAVEPAPAMIAVARAAGPAVGPLAFVRARGEALPLPDGSADVVLATWLLANSRPEIRARIVAECRRVARTGAPILAVENHWTGEFQALRRRPATYESAEIRPLIEDLGFRLAGVVSTEIRFPDLAEARRVLGYLLGSGARVERPVVGHEVAILSN